MTVMHDFDIEKSKEVLNVWRELEDATSETINAKLPAPNSASRSERRALQADVRFGTPTALTSARLRDMGKRSSYENHFASYRALSGSFDQSPVLPLKEVEISDPAAEVKLDEQRRELRTSMDREKTVNKKEPKDLPVDRPLLDMFELELAKLMSVGPLPIANSTSALDNASKLSSDTQASSAISAGHIPTGGPSADVLRSVTPPTEHIPTGGLPAGILRSVTSLTEPNQGPTIEQPAYPSTPAEVLGRSIKSLFDGVGLLAATFNLTTTELQQHIKHAQQDFPNNVGTAARASAAALNSLREVVVNAAATVGGGQEVRTEPQETVQNVEQEVAPKQIQKETNSSPGPKAWDLVKICKGCKV